MTDMTKTIAPKSDQLNADDLIGTTRDITITKVSLLGEPDQPVAINYEGDNGKPFKPCRSMRRVLVMVWGGDGAKYVGRSLRLYRDDKVTFGGMAVGGIRISHMSHIDRDVTMALTASKASRKPFTVKPLAASQGAAERPRADEAPQAQSSARAPASLAERVTNATTAMMGAKDASALDRVWASENMKRLIADADAQDPEGEALRLADNYATAIKRFEPETTF